MVGPDNSPCKCRSPARVVQFCGTFLVLGLSFGASLVWIMYVSCAGRFAGGHYLGICSRFGFALLRHCSMLSWSLLSTFPLCRELYDHALACSGLGCGGGGCRGASEPRSCDILGLPSPTNHISQHEIRSGLVYPGHT